MAVNEGNIHYVEFRGDTSQLRKEINLLSAKLNELGKNTSVQTSSIAGNTKKMSTSMASSFSSLNRLISGLGISVGIGAITSGLKSMLSASAELENVRTTFRVFTGSVALANATLSDLKRAALESPLNFQDFVQGSKTLMGYGVSASQVTGIVKMLGDVSGGSADRFQRLSLAFGQVVGAGRLMGQEARQMINAGFNPLQFIAEKTGKSMAQLQDEMRKGQISVQDVADAFKIATSEGGRFYGLSQEITNTLGGQWNKLQESIFFTLAEIGDKIASTFNLKQIVSDISDYMTKLKNEIVSALGSFEFNQYTITYLKEFYTAIGNIILALPKLIGLLVKLGEAIQMLNPFFWIALASFKALNLAVDKFNGKKVEPIFNKTNFDSILYTNKELAEIEYNLNEINKRIKQGGTDQFGMLVNVEDLKRQRDELLKTRQAIIDATKPRKSGKGSPSQEELDKIKEQQLKEYRSWEDAYANQQKLKEKALKEGVDFTQFTNDRLLEESVGAQGKQIFELTKYFHKVRELYKQNGLDVMPLYESFQEQATKIQLDFAKKRVQDLKNMMDKSIETFQKGMEDMQEGFNLLTSGGIKGFLDGLKDPDPLGTFFVNAFANATAFAESVPSLIGQGFGEIISGTVNFGEGMRRIGNSVLGALGDFVKGLGEQLIKFGIASTGIQAALASILTPAGAAAAIGIGTVLVALGSAMKNASQSQGQSVGGNARPSRVSATPVGRTSSKSMQSGSTYQYGGGTFATQSIKLSIDLTGSITASPTGYNISKQYETIARVTGR